MCSQGKVPWTPQGPQSRAVLPSPWLQSAAHCLVGVGAALPLSLAQGGWGWGAAIRAAHAHLLTPEAGGAVCPLVSEFSGP